MLRIFRTLVGVSVVVFLAAPGATAQPATRATCEAAHPAKSGQAGKDVIWVPTPDDVVHTMLTMTKVTAQDLVADLGAGDGRIPIAAARDFGAHAIGIEYDPEMAKLASCLVEAEGVAGKARIVQGDIFKEDFSKATVVTMYLLPDLNVCVRHRILAMPPGTRVASHQFRMGEWEPDETTDIQFRNVYLWLVPARVDGVWDFRGATAKPFSADLNQVFGMVGGEVIDGADRRPIHDGRIRGTEIRFSFEDEKGATRAFTGTVRGNDIAGKLSGAGAEADVQGTLHGALRPAPWAEMPATCAHFYGK
jgi:hypothetical protein